MAFLRSVLGTVKAICEAVQVPIDVLAQLAILVGVPITVYQIIAARHEAHDHALEVHEQVYAGLDAQYTDFLKVCLNHPNLDCFDLPDVCLKHPDLECLKLPDDLPVSLSDREKAQQRVLYAILIPMLEHAYLAYHGHAAMEIKTTTEAQWPGWELYARYFMRRRAFLAVWKELRPEFDKNFRACMNSLEPEGKELDGKACDPSFVGD